MDLNKLSTKQLQTKLKEAGLPVSGSKAILISRLEKGKKSKKDLTVVELKKQLKDKDLPTTGNKEVLKKRLEDSLKTSIKEVPVSLSEHPKCINNTTLAGWNFEEFPAKDIIHSQGYCFTTNDKAFIYKGLNPYTKKKLPPKIVNKIEESPIRPPNSYIEKGLCPIFVSEDPSTVYVSKEPNKYSNLYDRVDSAIHHDIKIYYKGILKPNIPNNNRDYLEENFINLTLVYDPYSPDSLKTKIIKDNNKIYELYGEKYEYGPWSYVNKKGLKSALSYYMSRRNVRISIELREDIRSQKIRINSPIKVYRGFSFEYDEDKPKEKQFPWKTEIGENMRLSELSNISSWTTDICIALHFAKQAEIGYVVSYTAQPDEIVLDTRLLKSEAFLELYIEIQNEIILDSIERTVTVEILTLDDTILKSTKESVTKYILY